MNCKFKLVVILILMTASSIVFRATAQCETVTPDESSDVPYAHRSNRCEGFYEALVGAPSIEVVGFYKGKFDFKTQPDEVLVVTAEISDHQNWKLQGVGIPLDYYYRLDASFGEDGTLEWPVLEVLHPKQIKNNHIGIYAWRIENDRYYYSPVSVKTKQLGDLRDNKLKLLIRAATSVNEVYWRENGSSWNRINKTFAAGQAVMIELIASDDEALTVEFKLKERSSGNWISKKLNLKL